MRTIADLIRLAIGHVDSETATTTRGMPQISVGRPITTDDVLSSDDDA